MELSDCLLTAAFSEQMCLWWLLLLLMLLTMVCAVSMTPSEQGTMEEEVKNEKEGENQSATQHNQHHKVIHTHIKH